MAFGRGPNIVTDGLVLALDAGSHKSYPGSGTTAYDLSGNLNSGSLENGTGFSTNNQGVWDFDGTNDYITFPHDSSITPTSVTVDFWFNTDNVNQAYQALVSKRTTYGEGAYWIYLTDKTFYFDTYQNSIQNRMTILYSALASDTWYNVTFTYGTNGKFIYLNGQQIGNAAYGGDLTSTTIRLDIGNSTNSSNSYPFNGQLSNLKIYNRQLTVDNIQQNYNATKSRFNL